MYLALRDSKLNGLDTKNALAESDAENYQNIFVHAPPQQFLAPHIKELKNFLRPSKTDQGDGSYSHAFFFENDSNFSSNLRYSRGDQYDYHFL